MILNQGSGKPLTKANGEDHFKQFFFDKYKDLIPFLEKIGTDFNIELGEDGCFYFESDDTGPLNLEEEEVVEMLKKLGTTSSTMH